MASRNLLALMALAALAACADRPEPLQVIQPVRVEVPVPVRTAPPAELLEAYSVELPVFISPTDQGASSALTPVGERSLKSMINGLVTRLQAWEAWATAPQQ